MIFVTMGNSNFQFFRLKYRLLNAVKAGAIKQEELRIQNGSTDWGDQAVSFTREYQLASIAQAEAVISHCGVGTLLDCWRAGHKPIVLPRQLSHAEHISNHQLELYVTLIQHNMIFPLPVEPKDIAETIRQAKAGRPWVFPDKSRLPDVLDELIEEVIAR